ncbi:GntR family transcriptional regulator [bacterium]|nr:GntR family transcriptional regulator [bacterium]
MNTRTIILPPISPAAPGPLYQQIVDGFKREISEGRIEAGQALPSFRILAEELMVSLITVKRAYEELEREGIIYRKQGLGTFVSENGADRNREAKRTLAEQLMKNAVQTAHEAGMQPGDIKKLLHSIIERQEGETRHE